MTSKPRTPPKQRQPRLSHSHWMSHIERCRASHASPAEYCERQGLSLKGFKQHDWLHRREHKTVTGNFAAVTISSEPVMAVSHYELVFRRGVLLRLPMNSSLPELLKSLECYL